MELIRSDVVTWCYLQGFLNSRGPSEHSVDFKSGVAISIWCAWPWKRQPGVASPSTLTWRWRLQGFPWSCSGAIDGSTHVEICSQLAQHSERRHKFRVSAKVTNPPDRSYPPRIHVLAWSDLDYNDDGNNVWVGCGSPFLWKNSNLNWSSTRRTVRWFLTKADDPIFDPHFCSMARDSQEKIWWWRMAPS